MNRMSLPPKYSCLLIGLMGVLLGVVEWLFEPDSSILDDLRSPQGQQILQNLSGPLAVVMFMASVLRRQIIYALGHNILDDTVCMSVPYWFIGHLSRLRPLHRTGVFVLVTLSLQGAWAYWQWGYGSALLFGIEWLEILCVTTAYLISARHRLLMTVSCAMVCNVVMLGCDYVVAMPMLWARMQSVETARPLPGGLAPDGRHHVAHEVEQDL
ncbi:hypothetical protein B0W47_09205 [Komagataeibacter nataicola]|uniref:Uncharacterized protein n=1 Tax=Komagataeibacter nataicola TaxID=265960 RepID=A0A9N7CRK9_9PROT|nr:hypothetical protein [Komagataeibacter nataicola]AQU87621.1 hypothetical protein B0W47_09205 [Komagataeibacter nataicola]PYD67011.1 hypothetical protein CDI09_04950 [Komagataeibacter nataicola]WEQ55357.1 hypothetical protein LV564_14905 [Komagataeibacter nataicola]WNM09771.1 hypothetical protein RI056_07760 [Komagataeibacter nataicola]GBR17894.1 hypothetical protein AA0616_1165 [Komagataeibacter nataicola NRIC 0616]